MSRTTTKIIIAQEDGTVVGQYFLGDGEHLIGREGHCTIQLEANQVSREHARLIISAEAIEIEDLNSTTGTFVDGITLKGRIPLSPGQKLWISNLYIDIERQGFGGLIEGSRLGNGRFTLQRELGKGGMGAVWLALDEKTQENFAIKLVSGEISMDSKGLKDLQREVNKSHKLVHPNIVRMGYFWKEEGEPAFISLEYVDGTDLHQIRSDSSKSLLAWEEVKSYMLQLCDALEYAHAQKVAHRDIKPSNFMINSAGNLKLADFGIAASLANTSSTFTSNTVLGSGTPPYMSPQQLDGERPQVTDDIYSVGATFYELLTSKPPFYRGDIAYQVRHTEVIPMAERLEELELANDIPEYVNAIVMACLQKDPGKRPQSMGVIREWIQSGKAVAVEAETVSPVSASGTQTLEATPSPASTKTVKKLAEPAEGRRTNYAVAAIALALVVGLGIWLKGQIEDLGGAEENAGVKEREALPGVDPNQSAATKPKSTTIPPIATKPNTTTIPSIATTPSATYPATKFAFFQDSKKIALLDGKKGWFVWDIQNGKRERLLAMDGSGFVGFAPAPEHNVWTINKEGALQSVDPKTGKIISKLLQLDLPRWLRLSQNHKWLAVIPKEGGAIDLWKIDGTSFTKNQRLPAPGVKHIAFSPDGTKLAANYRYSGKLVCWDLLQMKKIYTKSYGYLGDCAFSPDGNLLIAPAISSGEIHVLRADNGEETEPLIGHKGGAKRVDFSSDGRHLVSCGHMYAQGSKADGTIRVWDIQKREQIQYWQANSFPGLISVKFSPDGNWLASMGGRNRTVKLWKVSYKKAAPTPDSPKPGTLLWEFETGGEVYSSPAIGSDGTVYIGSGDKKVYALNGATGVKLWEFVAGDAVNSSPAIGSDGTLYVGSYDNKIYALDGKTGAKKWEYLTGDYVPSHPSIGADGTVYVGSNDKKVYALNGKTGIKKWEFLRGGAGQSSPAIGTDGTVYIGSAGHMAYALDGKIGTKKWGFPARSYVSSSPAIGVGGTIYVGSYDKKIYALDGESGAKKWEFLTGGYVPSSLAIGADGTVYVGSWDKKIYALDGQTGVKKWEYLTGDKVVSSPTIGADGTIYIGSNDEKIYALDGVSGTKQWEFITGDDVRSSPAIGSDGTLYVGSDDNKVYAIKTDSIGPAKSPWPMRGQNAQHTGRAPKK